MTKLNEILIIDDEKDICEQISGLLNDKGFETKSMISSEEAINSFKKKDYSLVILDIWLNNSKLDGFQTLEKILEINVNVPITNCPINLYNDFKPLEFWCLILRISSNRPKQPKLNDTKIKVQIKILVKSAQSKVLEIIPIIIITPPIVGVPDFFTI